MTTRPRSFISLYPADTKSKRDNMRRAPLDIHDLQAQLRGDVPFEDDNKHDWSTSWWVPVLFLAGLVALVALVLHYAELID